MMMRPGPSIPLVVLALALCSVSEAVADPPPPLPCSGSCWQPALDSRWQYQLQNLAAYESTGGINLGVCAVPFTGGPCVRPVVFDIDLYDLDGVTPNLRATNAIHARGGRALCYVSAGSWENWRPDAAAFPESVKGRKNGWPGERWLDIRQLSILLPIMEARVQKCRQARFDGVEWDNVDGYSNRTGLPLTYADQLAYNASLANLAHKYGLSVALKNDVEQLADLAPYFDYAVNEQCQQYNECGGYTTHFINDGKAVWQVEYKLSLGKFCPQANSADRNAIYKSFDLFDTPYTPCR
jgi:hypothetical protein